MQQEQLHVVFMTRQPYPHGMAGTKILQNLIDALRPFPEVCTQVLVLRGRHAGLRCTDPAGVYRGTPYRVIGAHRGSGLGAICHAPTDYRHAVAHLRQVHDPAVGNVLFIYGGPDLANLWIIGQARRLGYKTAFYLVEDVRVMPPAAGLGAWLDRQGERLLSKRIGRLADAVFAISTHLQAKAERLCKNRCPVTLLPISVNPGDYPAEPTPFHDPVRIVYGGMFAEKDGVEDLIEAFDRVADTYPDVELILTGQAREERLEAVRARVRAARHCDRIHYKGYLAAEEYYPFLAEGDILCAIRRGSAFAATGFPFKLGEYLATGKPVIATAIGDIPRYLHDRTDAVLVPPDSVPALVEAMEYLLADRARAQRLGHAGRQVAWECFSIDTLAQPLRERLAAL